METEIEVVDFGISCYREIWDKQKLLFNELVECKKRHEPIGKEYILLGEHQPVYTLGFHGKASNMLASETSLQQNGAELIRIERGGDITYHGPGQLIVYPILDLEQRNLGIRSFMSILEDSVIELLAEYGIKGEKIDGATGIWIDKGGERERKICAMGVKCSRHITMHGLAVNINTDLTAFNLINPCGFIDKGVTSLANETGKEVDMSEIKDRITKILLRLFKLSR